MPVSILAVVSEADLPLPLLGLAHPATHQGTAAPEATQHLGRKWERSGVYLQAKSLSYETKVMLRKKPIKQPKQSRTKTTSHFY